MPQPLDSVLVRVQTGTAAGRGSLPAAVKDLLSSGGGARSFWKGAAPMMWSVPAQNALLFAGYGAGLGWCSQGERQQDGAPSSLWHVFAGGCAGGFAQVRCCVFARSPACFLSCLPLWGLYSVSRSRSLPPCLCLVRCLWLCLDACTVTFVYVLALLVSYRMYSDLSKEGLSSVELPCLTETDGFCTRVKSGNNSTSANDDNQ